MMLGVAVPIIQTVARFIPTVARLGVRTGLPVVGKYSKYYSGLSRYGKNTASNIATSLISTSAGVIFSNPQRLSTKVNTGIMINNMPYGYGRTRYFRRRFMSRSRFSRPARRYGRYGRSRPYGFRRVRMF